MALAQEKAASTLKCAECGKELLPSDEERRWAKCSFCGKAICFNCIRYIGTTIRGLYLDYVEAVRTCNGCYVRRG